MLTTESAYRQNRYFAETIVDATIVESDPTAAQMGAASRAGVLDLIELILKNPGQLEKVIRRPGLQSQLVPRFLAIALTGFVFFGVALSLVFCAAGQWPRLTPMNDLVSGSGEALIAFETSQSTEPWFRRWLDGSAPKLVAAYAIGLVAATGVCLPSLYFYGLLAGVRMTMSDVVLHTLKSKATAAVALVGVLPIYAAIGLGIVVFNLPDSVRVATFWLGLVLPFLTGLFGTHSLYHGFAGLSDTLSPNRRCQRECFLRRLVLSWSACYTAVMPIMIYTLWVSFNG